MLRLAIGKGNRATLIRSYKCNLTPVHCGMGPVASWQHIVNTHVNICLTADLMN